MIEYSPPRSSSKSSSSDYDTDNPTTSHKHPVSPNPFRRNRPHLSPRHIFKTIQQIEQAQAHHHTLQHRMAHLEAQTRKYLAARRYSRAEKAQAKMRELKEALDREQLNRLVADQQRERSTAQQTHQRHIDQLDKMWGDYFRRLRRREQDIMGQFEAEERRKIEKEREVLRRRCRSLRVNRSASLELERKKKYYLGVGDYRSVRLLEPAIQRTRRRESRERRERVRSMVESAEKELVIGRNKRYSVLAARLEENHREKETTYKTERRRLKQRYRNVVAQLGHSQKMERHFAVQMLLKDY